VPSRTETIPRSNRTHTTPHTCIGYADYETQVDVEHRHFSRKEQYHILNLAHTDRLCSHAGNDTHLAERVEREDVLKGEHISLDVSAYSNSSSTV
jgi:hypothetical protein